MGGVPASRIRSARTPSIAVLALSSALQAPADGAARNASICTILLFKSGIKHVSLACKAPRVQHSMDTYFCW